MKRESEIFFDCFATGTSVDKSSSNSDEINQLYDNLKSGKCTLVRAVSLEFANLVYSFLEPLFAYEDAYEGLNVYHVRDKALIVYECGVMPNVVYEELKDIEGHTIRQLFSDGTEIKSTFHKYR